MPEFHISVRQDEIQNTIPKPFQDGETVPINVEIAFYGNVARHITNVTFPDGQRAYLSDIAENRVKSICELRNLSTTY